MNDDYTSPLTPEVFLSLHGKTHTIESFNQSTMLQIEC